MARGKGKRFPRKSPNSGDKMIATTIARNQKLDER
jgi:hypothetical protein